MYIFNDNNISVECGGISGCWWYYQSAVKAGLARLARLAQLRQSSNLYKVKVRAGSAPCSFVKSIKTLEEFSPFISLEL